MLSFDPRHAADQPPTSICLSSGGLKVGLLSNRHSGRNIRSLPKIQKILATQSHVLHRLVRTPDDIGKVLEEFAAQQVDLVAINGGDGTVAATLTSLFSNEPFDRLPPLALLPGGTTNMNAADCGMRGNLGRAINKLCSWAATGRPEGSLVHRHVLRVEPGRGQAPQYGMFFGSGAIIQGTEYCHTHLHSRGLVNEIGPGLTMLRTLWGIVRGEARFAAPVPMSIRLDQQAASDDKQQVLILLVSSLERLFLGMRPYWGQENGPLHLSLILDQAQHLLRAFPALLRGRPNRFVTTKAGYSSHNIGQLQLQMDSAFVLDGELYPASSESGPVRIRDGGQVRFIQL